MRLTPSMLASLCIAVGRLVDVIATDSWSALVALARVQPVDVAVVDPCLEAGSEGIEAVRALRTLAPDLPVVLYTRAAPQAFYAALELAACGVRLWAFERFDDTPERLRSLVETARLPELEDQLLRELLSPATVATAPGRLADALRRVFLFPGSVRDQRAFAALAGVSLRHLQRSLAALGLASPRVVLRAARLLRAYQYAQHPQRTVAEIAYRLGYGDPRDLAAHTKAFTGVVPTTLRAMPPQDVIDIVLRRLRRVAA